MKNNVFEDYLPLVKSIAGKFKYSNVPFDDLVQEGLLGVIEAQKRYNPEKGTLFSTYTTYWIRKRIMEYIKKEKKNSLDSFSLNEDWNEELEEKSYNLPEDNYKSNIENPDIFDGLDEIETKILRFSFEECKPLNVISKELNISRERVRQYKQRALRKLRVNKKLTDYLYLVNK
jgi:RNA polymerase sigma factor (sigma-70 family)